jgi:uncharacterized protein YgiM (DUF1202 family)
MLSTSLLAQPVSNPPPATSDTATPAVTNAAPAPPVLATPTAEATAMTNVPAAATNVPAAKSAKKKSGKKKSDGKAAAKKSAPLQTVPLAMGPAFVIANNVNVRAQAKLKSEVIGKLTNQEPVTVIEEIVRNDSGPDEPSAWAKINLPAGAHTWVNTSFIDSNTKTVKAKKLNVRSGAGENYSVIASLKQGDAVKEVTTKGDWTEIEAPAGAYAFVAAQFLRQEASTPVATLTEPAKSNEVAAAALTTAAVSEAPAVATNTTETPTAAAAATAETAPSNTVAEAGTTNSTVADTNTPPEPPPKRIVSHEGYVRGTTSIQAPTSFALVSPENGRTIDYLFTDSPGVDLRRYKGIRIIVTGEEAIEDRWPNTPVMTIQQIHVLSE